VLLALVAMPLGVWLGLMAAQALYDSFSTEAYSFQAVIYPSSVAAIVVVNIAVLLLSEIPPIRRVSKMDLGEATKVME
jgi:ABC-type lipoprotein release transport system permease subunit